jgi:16S rRNA (guanine1516-N2)-methyltransferase
MQPFKIGILPTASDLIPRAKQLAQELNLTLTDNSTDWDYVLLVNPDSLALQNLSAKTKPLIVDFNDKKISYRLNKLSIKNEAVARACGLKRNQPVSIIDTTAGLGLDSFILAALGFEITLLERSPIIYALLADGLRRASAEPKLAAITNRMHLHHADAQIWLASHAKADIIYLDPMFPTRQKTALIKKEMAFCQDILVPAADTENLFTTALACALKRVVVKRPRLGLYLAQRTPSYSLTGSSSRFDIYLI